MFFARSQTAGFLQDALVELACGPGEKDPQQLAEWQTQAAQLVSASTNTSTTSALGELAMRFLHQVQL
jgi:hypothetical protein